MMRSWLAAALLAAALAAPAADNAKVSRAAMEAMEVSFDKRISGLIVEDPIDLLGPTRGVYLDGYGAVFTAEVSLVVVPPISPFRRSITKEQTEKVHQRKLQRVPVLKRAMRDMLVASAASLDTVPAGEQIAIGVTLFRFSWEDGSGLPSQVLMQAQRQRLLDYQAGRINEDALRGSIREQEF